MAVINALHHIIGKFFFQLCKNGIRQNGENLIGGRFHQNRDIQSRQCIAQLLRQPVGEGGFGYDPIFYVESEGATFAQIPAERKNAISHRANALKLLVQELAQRGL